MSIEEGLRMDTWPPWAVLWISIIDGGFIVPDTVIGVSSEQIGGRIVVIPCLGLIILGLHILCVLNKYVKKKESAQIYMRERRLIGAQISI
jgi:hypothetical protein